MAGRTCTTGHGLPLVNEKSRFTGRKLVVIGPYPLPGSPLSVSTVLDGSGNGSISIGPQRVREHWQVSSVGVSVSTNVNEAEAACNVGSPPANAGNFFGQTATGSTGDTCSVGQDIVPGQLVMVTWTGGDPGEIATATIYGTYSIGT